MKGCCLAQQGALDPGLCYWCCLALDHLRPHQFGIFDSFVDGSSLAVLAASAKLPAELRGLRHGAITFRR